MTYKLGEMLVTVSYSLKKFHKGNDSTIDNAIACRDIIVFKLCLYSTL